MPEATLHRVVVRGVTLEQLAARRGGVALPAYRYRFRQALERFVARPRALRLPRGPLVLLVDGLWFQFDGRPWVLYLSAVRACQGHTAVFLDPLLFPGKEGVRHWEHVLAAIPPDAARRIQALVGDNLPGLRRLARRHGWVLQLCHFHLLLKLQVHRRGVHYRLRGGPIRLAIYQAIRHALELPEGPRLRRTLRRLERLAAADCGTSRIQMAVRECLRGLAFYRAYRLHPHLGLPCTTNALESMGRLLREMFRRSRAGSTPRAVHLWATAFIRLRPTITCTGYALNRNA
jgi:hypothetical protein